MNLKVYILFLFIIGNTALAKAQVLTELMDSSLSIKFVADDGVPEMILRLDKNFLESYDRLKVDYPEAQKITFYIFILASPGEKYRIDLLKITVDGTHVCNQNNLFNYQMIKAMHNANLTVLGRLDDQLNYTLPIHMQ